MRLTRDEMIEVLTSRTEKLDRYTDAQLKRALTALAPPKSAVRSGGTSRMVEVTNWGPNKINNIKALREVLNLSLADGKRDAEQSTPCKFFARDPASAKTLARLLNAAGTTARQL